MKGYAVIIVALTLLLLAVVFAAVIAHTGWLTHETLHEWKMRLADILERHEVEARVLFVAAYVVLGVFGIPVVTVLTPIGGYMLGWLEGAIWSVVGATLTGLLSYLLASHWLERWLRRRFTVRQRWLRMELNRHGASYMLLLRLLLVVPFLWINSMAGLTRAPLGHFIWTLIVGTAPVCALYAYAGSRLQFVHGLQDVMSPHVVGAFIVAAMMIVARLYWVKLRRYRKAVTR